MTSRSTAASASRCATNASDENRSNASRWPGFGIVVVRRGGRICSNDEYRCPQNAVPHARLSASMSAYSLPSQSRNAAADTSQ